MTVFDDVFKCLEVRQNTPLHVVFSTLFSVFGNVVKHVSCVIYYILFDFTPVVRNLHCTTSFAELQPKFMQVILETYAMAAL